MEREEVFESNGANLYGTLTFPDEGENFPVFLFLHGGFPQTRDGDVDSSRTDWYPNPIPSRKLFLDEANILLETGIASFRYDKRGSGKSEGDTNEAGLLGLVDDARNALAWLSNVPEIDPTRIGVLGQSEGSLIGLMLAAENPAVRYLVLQGSWYNRGDKVIKWQTENFWKSPQEVIDGMKQAVPLIYWMYHQLDEILERVENGEEYVLLGDHSFQFKWKLSWMREFIENSSSKFVPKVKCPVLLLQGELDHNTPAAEVPLLRDALISAGNSNVTAHIFPGLDHSFRRLGDPDEDFITAMKRPLDSTMINELVYWLNEQIRQ
jgi:dipeptidyl aminopeptidase/acylaminoacyl peptidase